jgi:hypothetical protein
VVSRENLIHPEIIINHYVKEKLEEYLKLYTGMNDGKEILIVAKSSLASDTDENLNNGFPYIIWSSFSNPRSVPRSIYPIKSGQLMYEIVTPEPDKTSKFMQTRSFITNLLDRNDESGKNLNDFIEGKSFKIDSINVSETSNSDYRTVTVYPKNTPIEAKNEEAFKLFLTKNAEKELLDMNRSLNGLYIGSSSSANISLNIPEGYFSASSSQSYSSKPNPKKPGETVPLGTIKPLLGKQIYFHCTSVFQLDFVDQLTKQDPRSTLDEQLIIKYEYHTTNIFEEIE